MLLVIPIFAGLLACMPEVVPVGNPERSKIDAGLTGIWVMGDDETVEGAYYFIPYDKRTWLLTGITFEAGDDSEFDANEMNTYDSIVTMMLDKNRGVGSKGIVGGGIDLYKAWITKLGGETFLTWSPVAVVNEEGGFDIEFAFNWRLQQHDPNHFTLQFIDVNGPAFEDVDLTNRRALEKVIRRHADEEGFFDDDKYPMMKVRPEHVQVFGQLLASVVGDT